MSSMAFSVLVEVFNAKFKTKIIYFDLELSFQWFKEVPSVYFNTVIIYKYRMPSQAKYRSKQFGNCNYHRL